MAKAKKTTSKIKANASEFEGNSNKKTKNSANELPVRRIYRSRNDVMVGGVCAGIAEYSYTDPTLIRLLWIVITIVSGFFPGLLAYIIAYIIMPLAPKKK